MGDRGEWPMPGYASADAILIGTWPLASGNSITVRGRQHSSGSVDVRVTADGVEYETATYPERHPSDAG